MDDWLSLANDFHIIEYIARICHQRGGRFRRVQHASAAKTDNHVTTTRRFHTFTNNFHSRLAVDLEFSYLDFPLRENFLHAWNCIRGISAHKKQTLHTPLNQLA